MTSPRRYARITRLALGAAALLTLLLTAQVYASRTLEHLPIKIGRVFAIEGLYWFAWALLVPLVFLVGDRLRVHALSRARQVAIWSTSAFAASFIHTLLEAAPARVSRVVVTTLTFPEMLVARFGGTIGENLLVFALLVLVYHAVAYYGEARARELRAADLEVRLARSELELLRMQIHPHFLFNTLHTVSALMDQNVGAARRVMTRLSDLLRLSLERSSAQEVRLEEELEFLEKYLDIQQTRFQDRLRVGFDIARETLDARVPSLLLQPLVENAIKHGVEPREDEGRITIVAARVGDVLRLEVHDNGAGATGGDARARADGTGVGLANTQARLRQLYGERQRLDLVRRPDGGTAVVVEIPFRTEVEPAIGDDGRSDTASEDEALP